MEDIKKVLYDLKFNKGLGVDVTSGQMLKEKDNQLNILGKNYCVWLLEVLNGDRQIPEHFRESRMIPLSKTGNS